MLGLFGMVLYRMVHHGKAKGPPCCPKEGIHMKQSVIGSSERLSMLTRFSKSKTALSLTSVSFKLG